MNLRLIRKYLLFTGLIFNVLFAYTVYVFGEKLIQDCSLPTVIYKAADKFSNYAVTQPVADFLTMVGNSLDTPLYYQKDFDRTQWPMVGPNYQNLPVAIDIPSKKIYVSDAKELINAIGKVQPGTTIVVADGEYAFSGKRLNVGKITPTQDNPVVLTAEHPGKVKLLMNSLEGIVLYQPYWTITGFQFIGKCGDQNQCEHAMHIVGNAQYAEITNNEFIDFNAAIKVNRAGQTYPDHGRVEYNHFYFTKPRTVNNPVTPINIDHGSDWVVSHNIIRDFIKTGGNKVSYGAFMKGGSNNGVFENNLVICNTTKKHFVRVTSVGLSIGGGGMADRRDGVDYQANNTIVRNNIIFHCSDVGIYVNGGRNSLINNNTLYNTAGIDLQLFQSTALVENNILSGHLNARDNAKILGDFGNIIISRGFFTNKEKLTDKFASPETGNFKIIDSYLDTRQSAVAYPVQNDTNITDFCGKTVTASDRFVGAFSDRNGCFDSK